MNLRSIAKTALFHASRHSGFNTASRHRHRKHLLTVCYHGVVPVEHVRRSYLENADAYLHRNAISVSRFQQQLRVLARHFHPVSPGDVLDWLDRRKQLPAHAVLVTLDDGFLNSFQHAAPILEHDGIPALFNLPTGYIGTDQVLWTIELDSIILSSKQPVLPMPNGMPGIRLPESVSGRIAVAERVRTACKEISNSRREKYIASLRVAALDAIEFDQELVRFMSWDDARSLVRRGFEIGSHSLCHPILTSLSAHDLVRELQDSKTQIEVQLKTACRFIAYPSGRRRDFSDDTIRAAEAAGYRAGFSLINSFTSADTPPFEIGRFCITADTSAARFEATVSGLYSYFRRD